MDPLSQASRQAAGLGQASAGTGAGSRIRKEVDSNDDHSSRACSGLSGDVPIDSASPLRMAVSKREDGMRKSIERNDEAREAAGWQLSMKTGRAKRGICGERS